MWFASMTQLLITRESGLDGSIPLCIEPKMGGWSYCY